MDPIERIIAEQSPDSARHLLVIDDPGLAEAAQEVAGRVSLWCDDCRDADLVAPELLVDSLDEESLAGVDMVWMRLPKALSALDEYAELIAAFADPQVQVIAAARTKNLTRSMNDVLAKHFEGVSASLGKNKCRALRAADAKPKELSWPRERLHPDLGIGVIAHGMVFATNKVDDGTVLLAARCPDLHGEVLVDFGCGSGILATLLARANREAEVHAVDTSWAAVDSTRITAEANGQRVDVHWAEALTGLGDDSVDVVVMNPPFHRGIAKDSEPALEMFAETGRVLRPGGELWCVYNSHLPWKARLNDAVGPTSVETQNPFYTLTRSVAR
ncbi:class I SAM-dependent methyltransferase [Propionibacterium sp.]|uniref:class I SAM-dependent methyltransferase n=1 Tax=Propionibacterium sp. TaxID=1977903 RepID=UPI0039EAB924